VKDLLAAVNAVVPAIARDERQALTADRKALVVDVRDRSELQGGGRITGAKKVLRGTLEFRADQASPC
jgi:rhodanese-related sulfurtransferase